MAVNFGSSVNVGQTGSFGTRVQLIEQRHQKDELWLGGESSIYGYSITQGLDDAKLLNRIEQDTGYAKGSLSWGYSVVSNDDKDSILFRDNNGSFLETNFKDNFFEIKSERQITSTFCDWSYGRPYDAYKMDQGGFTFYQLFNSGSGDGIQDSIFLNRVKNDMFRWGLTSIMQYEIGS